MPKISLKIHFPNSHDGYKMLQFDDSITVQKAVEEIYQKQNERKANLSATGKGDGFLLDGYLILLTIV